MMNTDLQEKTAEDTTPQPLTESPDSSEKILALLVEAGALSQRQIDYGKRILSKLDSPRPILVVLKELKHLDDERINEILRSNAQEFQLEGLLSALGLISDKDLRSVRKIRAEDQSKKTLREILVDYGFIADSKIVEFFSRRFGLSVMDPEISKIDRQLLAKAPFRTLEDHLFLPLRAEGGDVLVAFADPLDAGAAEAAAKIFGKRVKPAVAALETLKTALRSLQDKHHHPSVSSSDETSAVRIVESIIERAVQEGDISDIHIEPRQDKLHVRFRRDGVLVHFQDYPSDLIPSITGRLKILCSADIAERRRHQGGRLAFDLKNRRIDIRASFYVTIHGEKVVLRLLNRANSCLNLEEIGMTPLMLKRFREEALDCPSGIMIITGPTGSGKTTTVYSSINYIKNPQISIITAEDPVEYVIEDIAQCSINTGINLTYEETLRHIVRQDPDVIVIGEIRDVFSAQVAVQAALTGHKVLTTFHTEDSIGGLVRLLNLDIEAFLISSTVVCVAAQRLVRRVCPVCREPYHPKPMDLQRLDLALQDFEGAHFWKGAGCAHCSFTGYKGRVAVFELLLLDELVRNAILARKMSQEIRTIAMEANGLVTLLEDGIVKAAAGLTTAEELVRCLPRVHPPRPLSKLQRLSGDIA
jgi:type IV pilus assembly protein PilB